MASREKGLLARYGHCSGNHCMRVCADLNVGKFDNATPATRGGVESSTQAIHCSKRPMPINKKPYLQNLSIKPSADIEWESYPFNIPAVRELEKLKFHADVTFFVGENGAGKSTMMEAIALALGFGHEGGTRNVRFQTSTSESSLHRHLKLVTWFICLVQ